MGAAHHRGSSEQSVQTPPDFISAVKQPPARPPAEAGSPGFPCGRAAAPAGGGCRPEAAPRPPGSTPSGAVGALVDICQSTHSMRRLWGLFDAESRLFNAQDA